MKHLNWIMMIGVRLENKEVVAEFVRARVGQYPRSRVYRRLSTSSIRRLQRTLNDAAYMEIVLERDHLGVNVWSF